MPSILLNIDASDKSSTAVQRVTDSLAKFDQQMARISQSAQQSEVAMAKTLATFQRLDTSLGAGTKDLDKYATMLAKVAIAAKDAAGGLDTLASAAGRVSSAFMSMSTSVDSTITSQQRAVSSVNDLALQYRNLAAEQKVVADTQRTLNSSLGSTPKLGAGGGTTGGGGTSHGGGLGNNFLMQYAGYMIAADLMSQVTQGFTRGLDTARTMAMTGATTGISSTTQDALTRYIMQTAGSGKQPYTSDILATGLYAIPSAGVTNPAAIKAINDQATKFSAFTGSTDTGTATNALIQTMSAYGISQAQMAKQAEKFQDVITGMVNLGIVQPTEIAPAVTTFGSIAAQKGVGFGEAGGIMAALTYTTRSAQQSAFDEAAMLRNIAAPNQQQRKAAALLGVSDLFGSKAVDMPMSEWLPRLQKAIAPDPGLALQKLFDTNAGAGVMGLLGPGGANIARTLSVIQSVSAPNLTDIASNKYQQSPAAKFDDAMASFKTSTQLFATAALPLATAMANWGSNVAKGLGSAHPGDALNKALGTQNLPEWMQSAGGSVDSAMRAVGLMTPTGSGQTAAQRAATATALAQANYALAHPLGVVGSPSSTYQAMPAGGSVESYGRPGQRVFGGLINRDGGQGQYNALGSPTYGGMVTRDDRLGGGVGNFSLFQQWATATTRSAAGITPDIKAAQLRLSDTISGDMGKNAVESALGTLRQVINTNPLLSGGAKAADIFKAEKSVGAYERGLNAPGDQAAISAAQQNLDAAKMMGQTPAQYRTIFNEYLNAERQLARDTLRGGALAKSLGAINQQGAVESYIEKTDSTNRALKDLQNQAAIDKLAGRTGAYNADEHKILQFSSANRGILKLDASDLALMAANIATAAAAANPRQNTNPFFKQNAGIGGLIAGDQNTALRIGGVDPQTLAIRELTKELAAERAKNTALLQQIANNTAVRAQAGRQPPSYSGVRSHAS